MESKSKRPKDSKFRQQNLPAWRPILTPRLVICLFGLVGVAFVPIGIAVMAASDQVVEVESADYSASVADGGCCISNCDSTQSNLRVDANPCFINITVPKQMTPPIYFYYKLSNFYQNHRRYVKSRSDAQLRGIDTEVTLLNTSCQHRVLLNSSADSLINPCGLIAWSVFNDSYHLHDTRTGAKLPLDEKEIAWQSDIKMKFKNADAQKDEAGNRVTRGATGQNFPPFFNERMQSCDDFPYADNGTMNANKKLCMDTDAGWCFPGSGYCVEDEHFIVWMRTAGLPTFRKLYARLNTVLDPGTYQVRIHNGEWTDLYGGMYYNPAESEDFYYDNSVMPKNQTFLYPTHTFGGSKAIVMSTSSWIGGKNSFLGGAYLTVGIICILLSLGFAIKQHFCAIPR